MITIEKNVSNIFVSGSSPFFDSKIIDYQENFFSIKDFVFVFKLRDNNFTYIPNKTNKSYHIIENRPYHYSTPISDRVIRNSFTYYTINALMLDEDIFDTDKFFVVHNFSNIKKIISHVNRSLLSSWYDQFGQDNNHYYPQEQGVELLITKLDHDRNIPICNIDALYVIALLHKKNNNYMLNNTNIKIRDFYDLMILYSLEDPNEIEAAQQVYVSRSYTVKLVLPFRIEIADQIPDRTYIL